MKLFFIFLLFFQNFVFAQNIKTIKFENYDYVGTVNSNNQPHGSGIRNFYENGKIVKTISGNHINGKISGLTKIKRIKGDLTFFYESYYENDEFAYGRETCKIFKDNTPLDEYDIVFDKKDTTKGIGVRKMYENGIISTEIEGGISSSTMNLIGMGITKYYNENGKLYQERVGNFTDGKLNGKCKISTFRNDGKFLEDLYDGICEDDELIDGERITKNFNENGNLKLEMIGIVNDDIFRGTVKLYKNGKITGIQTGKFINGQLDGKGEGTFYDKNGVLERKEVGEYTNGMLNGKGEAMSFDENGILFKKYCGGFINDELKGKCKIDYYFGDGKTLKKYVDGNCLNGVVDGSGKSKFFDENGNVVAELIGVFKDEFMLNGTISYFENGKVISTYEGHFAEQSYKFNGNGELVNHETGFRIEGDFKNGEPEGNIKVYNKGRIFYEGGYSHSNFNGNGIAYSIENKTKVEGLFKDGKLIKVHKIYKTIDGISKEVTSVDSHDDYIHKLADELASNYERDLKDAIDGKWIKNPKSCKFCDGTGIRKICYSCNGKGVKHCNYCQGKKHISGKVCLHCEGKGFETCTTCHGKGKNIKCTHSIY